MRTESEVDRVLAAKSDPAKPARMCDANSIT